MNFVVVSSVGLKKVDRTSVCISSVRHLSSSLYTGHRQVVIWTGVLHVFGHMADSESSEQPLHPHILIRAFPSAKRIIGHYKMYQWRANARMRLRMRGINLNSAFCACSKTPFCFMRPI